MYRDYSVVSPSLSGILSHDSLQYDGLVRPVEIAEIFDRPSSAHTRYVAGSEDVEKARVVERYFFDLYGVLIKKLSNYAIVSEPSPDESVKIVAMVQELIRVKAYLAQANPRQ
ncbi:MAG: hypothetical protein M1459_01295 [Patescibacteria group bacterium]|nr:hypothetical protein [Patescibacteria group bacterium]